MSSGDFREIDTMRRMFKPMPEKTEQKTLGRVFYETMQRFFDQPENWQDVRPEDKEALELAAAAVVIEADKRRKQRENNFAEIVKLANHLKPCPGKNDPS